MAGYPFEGDPASFGGWIPHLLKAGGAFAASDSAHRTAIDTYMTTTHAAALGFLLIAFTPALAMASSFVFSSCFAWGNQEEAAHEKKRNITVDKTGVSAPQELERRSTLVRSKHCCKSLFGWSPMLLLMVIITSTSTHECLRGLELQFDGTPTWSTMSARALAEDSHHNLSTCILRACGDFACATYGTSKVEERALPTQDILVFEKVALDRQNEPNLLSHHTVVTPNVGVTGLFFEANAPLHAGIFTNATDVFVPVTVLEVNDSLYTSGDSTFLGDGATAIFSDIDVIEFIPEANALETFLEVNALLGIHITREQKGHAALSTKEQHVSDSARPLGPSEDDDDVENPKVYTDLDALMEVPILVSIPRTPANASTYEFSLPASSRSTLAGVWVLYMHALAALVSMGSWYRCMMMRCSESGACAHDGRATGGSTTRDEEDAGHQFHPGRPSTAGLPTFADTLMIRLQGRVALHRNIRDLTARHLRSVLRIPHKVRPHARTVFRHAELWRQYRRRTVCKEFSTGVQKGVHPSHPAHFCNRLVQDLQIEVEKVAQQPLTTLHTTGDGNCAWRAAHKAIELHGLASKYPTWRKQRQAQEALHEDGPRAAVGRIV
eukprot:6481202-Amphidinium_carterae.1